MPLSLFAAMILAERPCCNVVRVVAIAGFIDPSYTGTFTGTADVRVPGDGRPVYQNGLTGAYLSPFAIGQGRWDIGPDCKDNWILFCSPTSHLIPAALALLVRAGHPG